MFPRSSDPQPVHPVLLATGDVGADHVVPLSVLVSSLSAMPTMTRPLPDMQPPEVPTVKLLLRDHIAPGRAGVEDEGVGVAVRVAVAVAVDVEVALGIGVVLKLGRGAVKLTEPDVKIPV